MTMHDFLDALARNLYSSWLPETQSAKRNFTLNDLYLRLFRRDDHRTEADIQADVRQFILSAPFELEESDLRIVSLESPVGDRRRIDVEIGSTVIEVKRDLRRQRAKQEAEEQLAGYVEFRTNETGLRYVGVLTDGTEWDCYHLVEGRLQQVSSITLAPGDADRLVVWLEGVLATAHGIAPTAQNIEMRLGATSSAYALDRATLSSIYERNKSHPSVVMKRTLWARLLTSALGTQFEDTDDLFIEHSLLVNSAEIIAHAVLGLSLDSIAPAALLAGDKFDESGIYGVVEPDFFDWVIEIAEGETFVRTLSKRLARFEWSAVEQDVLKVLYESVIGAETRKRLGEYYTPDWLADVMVSETISDPLNSRVLDPACGSGTFLFHAVRKYVAAAEQAGINVRQILDGVTSHVIGMDLHPVAVTLARVTYLLAIGRGRLTNPSRGTIQIPVYLGDSLQWREQSSDLWSAGNLTISADDDRELFASQLHFPDTLLDDASRFDQLINELANRASQRRPGGPVPSLTAVFERLAIPQQNRPVIEGTFRTMCRLHDEERNHIWGYYVRNLARPLWLSRPGNQVDVLIGNPPWLAYRHMTTEMQAIFRRMSEARGLWAGAEVATHQDLAGLFAVRASELYLRIGGRFALVLPNAAIDRDHYAGFRSGHYGGRQGSIAIAFDRPWDLRRIRPHFFPRAASVVFGTRAEATPITPENQPIWSGRSMPEEAQIWSGRLAASNAPWPTASTALVRADGRVRRIGTLARSPYAPSFTQGAVFSPRMAFIVDQRDTSALGLPQGRIAVKSSRSVYEDKPWKELPDLVGVVESEFVRPYYAGDNLFPFRAGEPLLAVVPCNTRQLLTGEQIELHQGLQQWWARAEELWNAHRRSDRLTLTQQLNYQSKLSKQLPIPPLRVIYNASGMHISAAKISNRRAIISSALYWASVNTEDEANYLCAILNAPVTTDLVRPLMSYGKDERHIHKHVWEIPIPSYEAVNSTHRRLAELGAAAEGVAASFTIDPQLHFPATRRHMRALLDSTPTGREIDEIVYELIS